MPRKLPQRTCLGCRTVRSKREMIRIVRTPDGTLILDETGKRSGKGAYVCPRTECLELMMKGKRLERALEVSPPPSLYEEITRRIVAIGEERR